MVEQILKTLVALTRGEPGNIAYVLHRSTESPDELVFEEIFSSMEAVKENVQKPYIQNLGQEIKNPLAAPLEVKTYSEV